MSSSTGPKPEEQALEPALPVIDAHHHLRVTANGPHYMFPEFLADLRTGHNVVSTVAVEVGDAYCVDSPPELRPVGETEFMNGIAAIFGSGQYGIRGCEGIVGFADLRMGGRVAPVLDAHIAAAGGRFRGIRLTAQWHAEFKPPQHRERHVALGFVPSEHLLLEPQFREGLACLAPRKLAYDVSIFFTQIPDLIDLARAFPETTIVGGHFCWPLGVGPYEGKRKEVFVAWRKAMGELAECPNVVIKLSGLRWAGIEIPGYKRGSAGELGGQPSSAEFAAAWKLYIDACVEAFGADRCMFATNYPPERVVCSYSAMWNAFKRATAGYSAADRFALFAGTAARVYRLRRPGAPVA